MCPVNDFALRSHRHRALLGHVVFVMRALRQVREEWNWKHDC